MICVITGACRAGAAGGLQAVLEDREAGGRPDRAAGGAGAGDKAAQPGL